MTVNKNIPKHWQVKRFEDLLDYLQPTPFIVDSTEYSSDYKTPVLTAGKTFILGHTNESQGIFNSLPVIIFDDFTTANRLVNFPFKVKSSAMKILKPKDESVNLKFVFYYMQTVKITFDTHKRYWISVFSKLPISLPPLPEQRAIVSKIEELLSDLDNGKQQLLTAQQQLKVYRQSLLKAAFEGKLTAGWRESHKQGNSNSLALAAEPEENYGENGKLPEGWKRVKLNNLCNKIQDGSHFSPKVQYDEPGKNRFMYITAKNIRNNYMDFRKLTFVDKDFHDSIFGRCNPEYGDVLLTKDGMNTGEVTLNTLHDPISLLSSVCIFKTKRNLLISSYLKYFIQSPYGNKAIIESMTGTAIKRIVLRRIKDAKIILPSIVEQQIIVNELDSKLTVYDKIEETISHSLLQAETLRQSILKRAFEGRLV